MRIYANEKNSTFTVEKTPGNVLKNVNVDVNVNSDQMYLCHSDIFCINN